MPIFDYQCRGCGALFELLVRAGSDDQPQCPGCAGLDLERRLSVPAPPAGAGAPADFSRLGPPAGGSCCGGGCHAH